MTHDADTFQTAVSMFGAVEICVNNAGILDERVWEQMIAINMVINHNICTSLLAWEISTLPLACVYNSVYVYA